MRAFHATAAFAAAALMLLSGCDQLGIESAAAVAARREAEGKAVGGGCRHAARSIEQCYEMNKRADKAAVFAGWREMNDYMRENKIEPQPEPAEAPAVEVARADAASKNKADKADKADKAGEDDKGEKAERAEKADRAAKPAKH